ncbi:hypothetical protein [Natronoglycomyces albus]|uniref:Uncharacterized protein n=1 Tax=Natronoglycomyces albus TaxID=2811108 RepID=A0A895XRS3_9ACTN|nr:hypothetical protein [Natronoglycomyces albus]QSB04318.1 hypothetical protein JQS30_10960 [Natronoglycomyces albus]
MDPKKGEDTPTGEHKNSGLDLSVVQVLAAAGAATLGAVFATVIGVYGTIIGTAVLSLITSVGSVLLVHFTNKTTEKIKVPLKGAVGGRPNSQQSDYDGDATALLRPDWDTDAGAYRSTHIFAVGDPDATVEFGTVDENGRATGVATVTMADPTLAEELNFQGQNDLTVVEGGHPGPTGPEATDEDEKPSRKKLWVSIAVSTVLVFLITVVALTVMALAQDKNPNYYFSPSPGPSPGVMTPNVEESVDQWDPAPGGEDTNQPENDQGTAEPTEDSTPETTPPGDDSTDEGDAGDDEVDEDEDDDEDHEADADDPEPTPTRN